MTRVRKTFLALAVVAAAGLAEPERLGSVVW